MTAHNHLIVHDLNNVVYDILTSHIILHEAISTIKNQPIIKFKLPAPFQAEYVKFQQHIIAFHQDTHLYECTMNTLQLLCGMASRMTHTGIRLYPVAHRLDHVPSNTTTHTQDLRKLKNLLIDLQRSVISHQPSDLSTFWKMTQIHQALTNFLDINMGKTLLRFNTMGATLSTTPHHTSNIHNYIKHWQELVQNLKHDIAYTIATHASETWLCRFNIDRSYFSDPRIGTVLLNTELHYHTQDNHTQDNTSCTWEGKIRSLIYAVEKQTQYCHKFLCNQSGKPLETAVMLLLIEQINHLTKSTKKAQQHIAILAANMDQLHGGFDQLLHSSQAQHPNFFQEEIRNHIYFWDNIHVLCQAGLSLVLQFTHNHDTIKPPAHPYEFELLTT